MSKMKQLYTQMQEEGLSFNAVMSEDKAMMEEAHYYTLVDNVARWMIENRSVSILDDIEKKYLQMWTFQ